jgi:hypothetical protein
LYYINNPYPRGVLLHAGGLPVSNRARWRAKTLQQDSPKPGWPSGWSSWLMGQRQGSARHFKPGQWGEATFIKQNPYANREVAIAALNFNGLRGN